MNARDEVQLVVNGMRYSGWKSIRITRSVETVAGSFALDVSDRWDGSVAPWPIAEGDACRVEIGDTIVIDGYIDERSLSAKSDERTLSYTGRDRAGALVDCSAVLSQWTYYNVNLLDFATKLAEPFGVNVSVQAGLTLSRLPKVVVTPGDSVYEAIRRVTDHEGVLLVSDGVGGLLITGPDTGRAAPLVEGQNILSASVDYNSTNRFHHYVLMTQTAATDDAWGDATRVRAEAIDEGVTRTERVLLIRPDKGYTVADARKRVDWEARIRAAKAETVTIGVQGWRQPDGTLWPVNKLVRVKAPRMVGADGDLRISQVEHTIGDGGTLTELRLVRPDAFTPEPISATVKASGDLWPELAKGGV